MRLSMATSAPTESETDSTLARGSFQLLAGRVFFLIVGFVIAAILSRALGPISYGVYGVVISVLTWCERVASAGIPGATAVLIPRFDDKRANVENSARALLLVWSVLLFVALWFAAPRLANYLAIDNGTALIRIVAFNLPLMGFFFSQEGILNGRRKFRAQSALQVFQSGAKLIGVILLLIVGISVSRSLVVHVVATAITIVVMLMLFPPIMTFPTRTILKSMLRLALPGGIYVIGFSALANLSLWQVQASPESARESVGFFVASLNLTRILHMVPAALSSALFATLAWATAQRDRDLSRHHINEASRLSIGMLAPGCLILYVNAPEILALVFGREYAAGGSILGMLCLAFAFSALMDLWLNAISADGKFIIRAIIVVGLVPALYLTNEFFIPTEGAFGAAIASAIVLSIGAAIAGLLTLRKYGSLVPVVTLTRVLFGGAAIWILGRLFPGSGLWVLAAIAGQSIAYLLVLWITGELTKRDLAALPFIGGKFSR